MEPKSSSRWIRRLAGMVAAAAVVAGGSAGCSSTTTHEGEIVVAVQTDLSLPKDIKYVRVLIDSLGIVRFDSGSISVGPRPDLTIPATLGVLPGDKPDTPVRIRVVGFKDAGKPRMLREVITTVPPSRIVALRMPLQWLSDGSALAQPPAGGSASNLRDSLDPFEFYNACPDGQTDIAGTCVDSHVDSSQLPDFAPEDVFGGGGEDGSNGSCFDTQACLRSAYAVNPDGSCTVPAPVGDPSLVNVGIRFPAGGDGVCDPADPAAPCFVPLDRADQIGWSPLDLGQTGQGGSGNGTNPASDAGTASDDAGVPQRDAGGGGGGSDASAMVDAGFLPMNPMAEDAGASSQPFGRIQLPPAICKKLGLIAQAGGRVVVSAVCPSKTPKNPTCGPWSTVSGGTPITPVVDAGPTPTDDGSAGNDASTRTCQPVQCNGASGGSCDCTQVCSDGTYSLECTANFCRCMGPSGGKDLTISGAQVCSDPTTTQQVYASQCAPGGGTVDAGGNDSGTKPTLVITPQGAGVPYDGLTHNQLFMACMNNDCVNGDVTQIVTWSVVTGSLAGGFDGQGSYFTGNAGPGNDLIEASITVPQGVDAGGVPPGTYTAQASFSISPGGSDGGMSDAGFDAGFDSGAMDAGVTCPVPSCGGGTGDAGAQCNCGPVTCSDMLQHSMNCDGVTCQCYVNASPTTSFGQGGACMSPQSAFMSFCQ